MTRGGIKRFHLQRPPVSASTRITEPDPVQRRNRLLAWWRTHPLQGNAGDRAEPDIARREEAVLIQWQAQKSEDRDVGELEEMLEDLRPAQQEPSGNGNR